MPDPQYITPTLEGDGRRPVKPSPAYNHPGNPRSVPLGAARMLVESFQKSGQSFHSTEGALVWIIIEWADLNSVPIRVTSTKFTHESGRASVTSYAVLRLRGQPVDFRHVDR